MNIDYPLIGLFGVVMIVIGYQGILVYARAFFDNPRGVMSADMLLAMLKGPGAVPVVLCLASMFCGREWRSNSIQKLKKKLKALLKKDGVVSFVVREKNKDGFQQANKRLNLLDIFMRYHTSLSGKLFITPYLG